MKLAKLLTIIALVVFISLEVCCQSNSNDDVIMTNERILFINGSPNRFVISLVADVYVPKEHGAQADTPFQHLATHMLTAAAQSNEWLESVTAAHTEGRRVSRPSVWGYVGRVRVGVGL